ncbi:MAG: hypothetical protein GY856_32800 [bacterium]|nr:hypothetical protein [bacterium]
MQKWILCFFMIVPVLVGSVTSAGEETPTGVLPNWVDASQAASLWIETPFPQREEFPLEISPASRFLIVKLEVTDVDDWIQAAYDLKNLVVDARTRSPELKVALDGPRAIVERLIPHGLAPYVDAYVYRREPVLPAGDPTARLWWRTGAGEEEVLSRLLEASARGAELVVLEDIVLDPAQRTLLDRIRATRSTDLKPQPAVDGIAQDRVHFFRDPDSGRHYLAVHLRPGELRRIAFTLGEGLEARDLYPQPADYEFVSYGRSGELVLFGQHRHYLFELRSEAPRPPHANVVVESSQIMDPYEIVVMNQVFQEGEAEKVRSLDVTEVLRTLAQRPRSRPVTREYRVFERRGHPIDYVWTALAISGVKYPKNKLWEGFIFDADQVLLDPLTIELDRTYEYAYLGEETLDGHRTWKIGFKPLKEGAYLTGTVWIDQKTHAHRKLRARQGGTLPPTVAREFTVDYQWVEDRGERYWTWTRNVGTAVLSYLGFHLPIQVEIERTGHQFNRAGLEQELATIYQSDAKIMRQTPEGLRWLTAAKTRRGRSRARQREADGGIRTASHERTLAERNAQAHRHRVGVVLLFDKDVDDDLFVLPGYSYFNLNLLGSKYQFYVNANEYYGFLSIARPDVLRKNWNLNLGVDAFAYRDREITMGTQRDEDVEVEGGSAEISLAMPLHPALAIYVRYRLDDVRYGSYAETDPAFVLPADHREHTGFVEVRFDLRGFSSELRVVYTTRDRWEPWGRNLEAPLERSWGRGFLRGGYYRQVTRNQSLGLFASYARGTGGDRFSRIPLGSSSVRVGGYSGRIRFVEGMGLQFNYSGHFLRLFPLQLRLDLGLVRLDEELDKFEHLIGFEVVTNLHGPWKTDLYLSLGQGLATSIEEAEDQQTRFVAVLSRRF